MKKTYGLREWWKRVEDEMEMPINEVIRLFIKDRYSRKMTSEVLEIDPKTLKRYCDRKKIKFPDRLDLREECKPKGGIRGIVRNPWGRGGKPKKGRNKKLKRN